MKEIRNGMKIGKHEIVGVIFEIDGIYYSVFGFGKMPEHSGNQVKVFKGDDEVLLAIEEMVDELNSNSIAFQRKRLELKQEKKYILKRVRRSVMSSQLKSRIKRMASDKKVFKFFS